MQLDRDLAPFATDVHTEVKRIKAHREQLVHASKTHVSAPHISSDGSVGCSGSGSGAKAGPSKGGTLLVVAKEADCAAM